MVPSDCKNFNFVLFWLMNVSVALPPGAITTPVGIVTRDCFNE